MPTFKGIYIKAKVNRTIDWMVIKENPVLIEDGTSAFVDNLSQLESVFWMDNFSQTSYITVDY